MSLQYRPHENASPTAPHAGFNEVSGNIVSEDGLNTISDILHPFQTDHRLGVLGPIHTYRAIRDVCGPLDDEFQVNRIQQLRDGFVCLPDGAFPCSPSGTGDGSVPFWKR